MGAIVEAIDLVAGTPPSPPLSLDVSAREIVGLLFPSSRSCRPLLRVLAGIDAPVVGAVRFQGRNQILLATPGRPLVEALASQPELVIVDAEKEAIDRTAWALMASERALGAAFVIATADLDQACRSDRVVLAAWDTAELSRALAELVAPMTERVQEFLGALEEGRRDRAATLAADLRRFNLGSRALLEEMRRRAHTSEAVLAWQGLSSRVAAVTVHERVLEAAMADAHDR